MIFDQRVNPFGEECKEEVDKILSALETPDQLFQQICSEIVAASKAEGTTPEASAVIVFARHLANIEAGLIRRMHIEHWQMEKIKKIDGGKI